MDGYTDEKLSAGRHWKGPGGCLQNMLVCRHARWSARGRPPSELATGPGNRWKTTTVFIRKCRFNPWQGCPTRPMGPSRLADVDLADHQQPGVLAEGLVEYEFQVADPITIQFHPGRGHVLFKTLNAQIPKTLIRLV